MWLGTNNKMTHFLPTVTLLLTIIHKLQVHKIKLSETYITRIPGKKKIKNDPPAAFSFSHKCNLLKAVTKYTSRPLSFPPGAKFFTLRHLKYKFITSLNQVNKNGENGILHICSESDSAFDDVFTGFISVNYVKFFSHSGNKKLAKISLFFFHCLFRIYSLSFLLSFIIIIINKLMSK